MNIMMAENLQQGEQVNTVYIMTFHTVSKFVLQTREPYE